MPVLQLREKMDSLPVGAVLEVLVDDPAAEEDFIRWAKHTEQQILKFEKKGTIMRFLIKKMM